MLTVKHRTFPAAPPHRLTRGGDTWRSKILSIRDKNPSGPRTLARKAATLLEACVTLRGRAYLVGSSAGLTSRAFRKWLSRKVSPSSGNPRTLGNATQFGRARAAGGTSGLRITLHHPLPQRERKLVWPLNGNSRCMFIGKYAGILFARAACALARRASASSIRSCCRAECPAADEMPAILVEPAYLTNTPMR